MKKNAKKEGNKTPGKKAKNSTVSKPEPDFLEGEDKPEVTRDDSASGVAFEDTAEPDNGLDQERKDVFDSGAAKWKVDGKMKDLFPYSSSRDSLFSRLRNKMGAPDIKEAIVDLSLFVGDAHLILFLCAHDELYLINRISQPDQLLLEVFSWADKNVPSETTDDAVTTALNIFFQKTTNQAEQAPDDDPLAPSELGN